MPELKCLFLEHDENEIDDLRDHLHDAWAEANPFVPLRLVLARTPREGRDLLEGSFHLLVADLLFPSADGKERAAGVHFIEWAHKTFPTSLAIIALSAAPEDDRVEAERAGADAFISKHDVFGSGRSIKEMAEVMEHVLRDKGHSALFAPAVTLHYSRTDWRTAAVVERIGRDRIVSLLAKLMKAQKLRLEHIDVHYIGSGWSGAFVIGARCQVLLQMPAQSTPTKQTVPVVLKVSRDRFALQAELDATDRIADVAPGVFLKFPARELPPPDEGWYGIASSQIEGKTLYDWLFDTRDEDEVDTLLERLFLHSSLHDVYTTYTETADRADTMVLQDLVHPRRYRIRAAYESLLKVTEPYISKEQGNLLIRILEESDLSWLGAPDVRGRRCLSHADLHLRNVLVDRSKTLRLIDAVNAKELHWASDLARLGVDLIISGWDADEREHAWNRFADWMNVVRAMIRNDLAAIVLSPDDHRNRPPRRALQWVARNVMNIHEHAGQQWQFHLALAAEFLRASYRTDTPSPKRVLGLAAGVAILEHLRDGGWSSS